MNITEILPNLISRETGPRDVEDVLSEMWRLVDTRELRKDDYLTEFDIQDNEGLAGALKELNETKSCTDFFWLVSHFTPYFLLEGLC